MCGICGKISADNFSNIDEALIRRMCGVLAHRGPDDEGIYVYPSPSACIRPPSAVKTGQPSPQKGEGIKVGLGHRRLSIIDLSAAGHQPMSNEDDTIWIVLNGEIYNFPELRKILEANGHKFRSRTDTEVILHLYEDKGADCLSDLRGMFALAIWDEKKGQLLLARDRLGKKPLYYTYNNRTLIFASEIKAIIQDPEVSIEVNRPAITDYLSYGYTPTPETMFKGIAKLPPAHMLLYKNGNVKQERYWRLDFSKKVKLSEDEYCDKSMELLEEATRLRLISDVPLGVFLSGGVDSSAVVYMMSKINSGPVKTFSIGFEEQSHSELKYAKLVAARFDTDHHEYIVKPDAIGLLPKLVWHYNEPYADSSALPSFYVAKMARQEVTVALNGDGGDEVFGGYERFMAARYAELFLKIPQPARRVIVKICSGGMLDAPDYNFSAKLRRFISIASNPLRERHYNWVTIFRDAQKESLFTEEFKKEIGNRRSFGHIDKVFEACALADIVDSVMCADINTNLPDDLLVKMDIAAMANSLEGRSPFLDHKLMEFSASIPSKIKIKGIKLKYIMKKALKGILPDEILSRGKMGFGIPVDSWFRGELKNYAREILLSERCVNRSYFKKEGINHILDEHSDGRARNGARIWSLLCLELWHRVFIDRDITV